MTLQTRVDKTLLKNMSKWKYRHKAGNGKSCGERKRAAQERGRKRLQTDLVSWEMEIHSPAGAREGTARCLAWQGQDREAWYRGKRDRKHSGNLQRSKMERHKGL